MKGLFVGIIGYGAVGSVLARRLVEGGATVCAYDVLMDGGTDAALDARANDAGVTLAPLSDVLASSEMVLSTVTTQVSLAVAKECAALLGAGQVYVDLNSSAPRVKGEIGAAIAPSGAEFLDGAIMGAIGATGADTRILLAGGHAAPAAQALCAAGLHVEAFSPRIGDASQFKMIRSIFSKGAEALLLECLLAAERAGLREEVLADLGAFMDARPFAAIATNWGCSHAVAHERRYHEMVQVEETARDLDLEPLMASATRRFFERSGTLGFQRAFSERPQDLGQVIAHLNKVL